MLVFCVQYPVTIVQCCTVHCTQECRKGPDTLSCVVTVKEDTRVSVRQRHNVIRHHPDVGFLPGGEAC